MKSTKLMHCLIITDCLDETRDFFVDIVGLRQGERPFAPPGYWLYIGNEAVIHLAGSNTQYKGVIDRTPALARNLQQVRNQVEHIAFEYEGYPALIEKLISEKIQFHEISVSRINQHQVLLADPNGVGIELNFALDKILHTEAYKRVLS